MHNSVLSTATASKTNSKVRKMNLMRTKGYHDAHVENSSHWALLGKELMQEIGYGGLHFGEIKTIVTVCKSWRRVICSKDFWERQCERVGIKPTENWIRDYSRFAADPQTIALDVSASMKINYKSQNEPVFETVAYICHKLTDVMAYKGIDCVVFTERQRVKRCFNFVDAMAFFSAEGQRLQRIDCGTNITELFKTLISKQNSKVAICPSITHRITVISDFETANLSFGNLDCGHNIEMQCIKTRPSHELTRFLYDCRVLADEDALMQFDVKKEELQERENVITKALASRVKLQDKHPKPSLKAVQRLTSSGSAKKNIRHQVVHVPRIDVEAEEAKSRKRKAKVFECNYEYPLQVIETALEAWEPMIKKRKITLAQSLQNYEPMARSYNTESYSSDTEMDDG